jgi:hypothetical protein
MPKAVMGKTYMGAAPQWAKDTSIQMMLTNKFGVKK